MIPPAFSGDDDEERLTQIAVVEVKPEPAWFYADGRGRPSPHKLEQRALAAVRGDSEMFVGKLGRDAASGSAVEKADLD
jgi:hypothetical protein